MNGGFTGNSLVVGDFTGDQIPDVLLPKSRKIGSIKTFRQPGSTPDLSFSSIVDYQFTAFTPIAADVPDRVLCAADFDQDGDTDTLIFDPYQESMVLAENATGAGNIISQHPISLAGRWWVSEDFGTTGHYEWITQDQVLILDADLDGDPDIITVPSALGNRVTLHRNQGGVFSLETLTDLTNWWDIESPWPTYFHLPEGPPGHLLAGRFIDSAAPIQFAIYGRTLDGLRRPTASITVAHGSIGDMHYGQAGTTPDFGSVAVCDFDGDELDDLLTAGTVGTDALGNVTEDTSIRFHRSLGDGTFAESVVVAVPPGLVSQLLAADFTGDGRPDIVAASKQTGMVGLYSHAEFTAYPGYAEWIAGFPGIDPATVADPDGDGVSNLLEFARGTPPDSKGLSDPRIPAPAVVAEIRTPTDFQTYVPGIATHPRPRLANGGSCEVILENSTDMVSWSTPQHLNPGISFDPAYPQWDKLSWRIPADPEKNFYRFKVVYRAGE